MTLRDRRPRPISVGASAVLACTVAAPTATGAAGQGGISVVPSAASQAKEIVVRKISCLKGCTTIDAAKAGATLRFQGPRLTAGKRVVYLGAPGEGDDILARLRIRRAGRDKVATAVLPQRAKSGPVAIEVKPGVRSPASAAAITLPGQTVLASTTAPVVGPGPFFPIRGAYRFGRGAAAFGGGRGHEGQDVLATCGTALVAAEAGRVSAKGFHARAGNYVVVDGADGTQDEVYMHLRAPAAVEEGATIPAGTAIGEVGDTGRASACMLHFELWQGNWQGIGGAGTPIDPLPTLKAWAAGPAVPAAH